jgi:hypothetical protein
MARIVTYVHRIRRREAADEGREVSPEEEAAAEAFIARMMRPPQPSCRMLSDVVDQHRAMHQVRLGDQPLLATAIGLNEQTAQGWQPGKRPNRMCPPSRSA